MTDPRPRSRRAGGAAGARAARPLPTTRIARVHDRVVDAGPAAPDVARLDRRRAADRPWPAPHRRRREPRRLGSRLRHDGRQAQYAPPVGNPDRRRPRRRRRDGDRARPPTTTGTTPPTAPARRSVQGEDATKRTPRDGDDAACRRAPNRSAGERAAQQAPVQVQVCLRGGDELPFTGFAAIPIVVVGALLIAVGALLRRRTQPVAVTVRLRAAAAPPARGAASCRRFSAVNRLTASCAYGCSGLRAAPRGPPAAGPRPPRPARAPACSAAPSSADRGAPPPPPCRPPGQRGRGARRTTRGARTAPAARYSAECGGDRPVDRRAQSPARSARCASMIGPCERSIDERHEREDQAPDARRGCRATARRPGAARPRPAPSPGAPSASPPAQNTHAVTRRHLPVPVDAGVDRPRRRHRGERRPCRRPVAQRPPPQRSEHARERDAEQRHARRCPARPASPGTPSARRDTLRYAGPVALPQQRVGARAGAAPRPLLEAALQRDLPDLDPPVVAELREPLARLRGGRRRPRVGEASHAVADAVRRPRPRARRPRARRRRRPRAPARGRGASRGARQRSSRASTSSSAARAAAAATASTASSTAVSRPVSSASAVGTAASSPSTPSASRRREPAERRERPVGR